MTAIDWVPAEWPVTAAIAGTSTRAGGVSRGAYGRLNLAAHVGDRAEHVAENRRRLRASRDLPAEPLWLHQVHGTAVCLADGAGAEGRGRPAAGAVADAAVTRVPGRVLAVLTADCLPVVLATETGSALGVAHAGWRGLAAGILEATVTAMACEPASLVAWLGPAISQAAFEVGGEVRAAFLARDPRATGCFAANRRGRWQADLYGLARLVLAAAGVTRVYGGGRCTHAERESFFSYRRDGECGRMATVAYLPQAPA